MALPPGSFNDSGREYSKGLEQKASRIEYELGKGNKKVTPIVFPENIGSPGAFNNHFMIIEIMEESMGRGTEDINKLKNGGNPSKRILKQADKTIILYMPNTLAFTTQNEYEEISLTSVGLGFLPGAMGTTIEQGAQLLNAPLNPRTEVLFSNTKVRQFQFDFMFAPSSEKESDTLKEIIYQMRLAAAVKRIDKFGISGLLWAPPRKLQIRFYSIINGVAAENGALPKLKPLVIDNLDFDFAPTGVYSTFTNGYPVSTRMMLRVREDEVIDREYIVQNEQSWSQDNGRN